MGRLSMSYVPYVLNLIDIGGNANKRVDVVGG